MLQRNKFWGIEIELSKRTNEEVSIFDLCKEVNHFVSSINSMELTHDFVMKLEYLKRAESSIKTILNMMFSKMNPQLNPIILTEDEITGNYNSVLLRLERLNEAMDNARTQLTQDLSNKIDIQTNKITNNSALSSFVLKLSDIYNNLIFLSFKQALESLNETESTTIIINDDKKGFKLKTKDSKLLFEYLVYCYFARTLQTTVPVFSGMKTSDAPIKMVSPEAKEYHRLTSKKNSNEEDIPEEDKILEEEFSEDED